MIGAMMMVTGKWMQPGVWNMEQLDPDPFMEQLNLRASLGSCRSSLELEG